MRLRPGGVVIGTVLNISELSAVGGLESRASDLDLVSPGGGPLYVAASVVDPVCSSQAGPFKQLKRQSVTIMSLYIFVSPIEGWPVQGIFAI
jgi:hypothetical protein